MFLGRSFGEPWPSGGRLPELPLAATGCPCEDTSLCAPIQGRRDKELYGFARNGSRAYNWDRITSVAWNQEPTIVCDAHRHGVRVIAATPKLVLSSDPAERKVWIDNLVASIRNGFMDGVTFDLEDALDKTPGSPTAERHAQYVALIGETTMALHSAVPGSQISVCVPWAPDNIDGRNYDFVALAAASDVLFVMAYAMRSQIFDRCIASANSPYALVERGLLRFLQLGVTPDKLILGTPWNGFMYPCLNSGAKDEYCGVKLKPWRDVNCSDAAGFPTPFMSIMDLLDRGICPGMFAGKDCNVTTPVRWDASTQSPYFNFVVDGKDLYQVWFDDARSSALKFGMARRLGIRGVGPYMWSFLDSDGSVTGNPQAPAESRAMWDALGVFFDGDSLVV